MDVSAFMKELASYKQPWSETRAKAIPLHKDTLAVHLRIAVANTVEETLDAQEDKKTDAYAHFPLLTSFLEEFSKKIRGTLARVTIVSLKPDSQVYRHYDAGTYYARRDRYHLVLQSPAGSRMVSGDEECVWHKGELWWFDNKAMHEAFNPSDGAERIHVIFDVLPNPPWWKKFLQT